MVKGNNVQIGKQQLINFFGYCAERMTLEINASDFLYALLKSSDEMLKIFLSFLDPNIRPPINIEREFSIKDIGRPDFRLLTEDCKTIIVEVKLFDTDYHEIKYSKIHNAKIFLLLVDPPKKSIPLVGV